MEQSDGKASVILGLGDAGYPFIASLPDQLRPRVIVPDWVPSMDQIEMF